MSYWTRRTLDLIDLVYAFLGALLIAAALALVLLMIVVAAAEGLR